MNSGETHTDRFLTFILHAIFFLSGISTVLIGQVLPVIALRFDLNDLEAGYCFPAQYAGSITGTILTNWFARAGNLVRASALGALLMAVGVLMLETGSYQLVLAGFLVNGLGIGLTLPAINVLILERNSLDCASALSFLNFFWGVGAIVSKPFVDATASGTSLLVTTALLAAPLGIAGALMFIVPGQAEVKVAKDSDDGENAISVWSRPLAWAISGFNFIHVGFESGVGGWLTTYTNRVDAAGTPQLFSPTLLFFLFFVLGRGIAPAFLRYIDENRMIMLSLLVILAGLAITLSASGTFQLGIGASLSGLGTSSIFPTNISRFSRTFGQAAMRRATPLFLCGTLGAVTVTWLIGFLSERFGSLRSGMFVLVGSVLTLLALQTFLSLRTSLKTSM